MSGNEYLLLKWGSVKGWSFKEVSPAKEAFRKYFDEPVCLAAAMQCDTDSQKKAILDCIDLLDGEIMNDWTGEKMTKEEAKKYILEYER